MRADDLAARFRMERHVEGGGYLELNEAATDSERAPSGVIYYHLGSGEYSDFHVLDSDEYWLWHAGSTLEIWMAAENGEMHLARLGVEGNASPCVRVPAGVVFGARHEIGAADGTFVSCVTVPRFSYANYRILPKAEVLEKYPAAAAFFDGIV